MMNIIALNTAPKDIKICVSYKMRSHRDKYWKTTESLTIILSNGDAIHIPEGFEWDFSSVPKFLWGILPPYGDFLIAALIHDYLYVSDYKRKENGDHTARLIADKEMLIWSRQFNSEQWGRRIGNWVRYYGVRLFGATIYKR